MTIDPLRIADARPAAPASLRRLLSDPKAQQYTTASHGRTVRPTLPLRSRV